jgi:hypothetical protein
VWDERLGSPLAGTRGWRLRTFTGKECSHTPPVKLHFLSATINAGSLSRVILIPEKLEMQCKILMLLRAFLSI